MEFALGIVGSLASSALPEVLSVIQEKLKGPLPAKKDVEDLRRNLGYIEAAIQDHYHEYEGKIITRLQEKWIANLRPLAYEIEDCIEGFLQQVMSDGKETEYASKIFGTEIGRLKEKVENMWSELNIFRANDVASSGRRLRRGRGPPTSSAPKPREQLVGMDKPFGELQRLVAESTNESKRKLKVISIVGFGGLGKTLLANQVYSKWEGSPAAWVRADGKGSQQLLKEIIKQVEDSLSTSNNVLALHGETFHTDDKASNVASRAVPEDGGHAAGQQVENLDKSVHEENDTYDNRLIKRLQSCLQNQRYLIVIIDMRDKKHWSAIKRAFPRTSGIDSRIIVTTTKQSVAKCCSSGDGHVYNMGALSTEDSRQLFFSGREVPSSAVLEQSEAILEKCDGLPLAVLSASEYFSGEAIDLRKSEQAFRKICEGHTIDVEEEDNMDAIERMQRILLSNYEGLPNPSMQVCLLYFCIFPRDRDVGRNSLIRRWLAEGLTETDDAAQNLDTLIDRSIIQSTQVSNDGGRMKRCRIPGIVLEYITRKSKSQEFVMVWDESQTSQQQLRDARRVSLHPNITASAQVPLKLPVELRKVRTLTVFSRKEGNTTVLENKEAIGGYKLLRLLDLEGCSGLDDSDIKNMCHKLLLLKYLSLGGSFSSTIPRDIKKLELLETLDLRKTQIHTIPVEVIKLPQLRNLLGKLQLDGHGIFRVRDKLTENKMVKKKLVKFLSADIGSRLEMLSGFVTGTSQGFPQLLILMTKLRKVKIWSDSTAHKKNFDDLSQGIRKFLRLTEKNNGRSLSINITDFPKELSADDFLDSLVRIAPAGKLATPPVTTPKYTPSASKEISFDIKHPRTAKALQKAHIMKKTAPAPHKEMEHHPSLYSFKLYGQLKNFPEFITQLNSITELCLSCTRLSPEIMLDGLNRLQNSTLKYLKLVEQELGPMVIRPEYFTSLERLCLVAHKTMGKVTIQDEALKHLVSLHILCGGLDGLSGIEIQNLTSLKELGLHCRVTDVTKAKWEEAAVSHQNWPNLVLVGPPKSTDEQGIPPSSTS